MKSNQNGPKRRPGRGEPEERYRQLVELAPDGILIHDGERIVVCNAAAVRLAGATSREGLIDQPIDRFLAPPYLKGVEVQLTELGYALESAPPVRDTFHRLDGSPVEVEVRAVAFMDQGKVSAHLVIRDITDRLTAEHAIRQMEERLHQAQRMETVGNLAGGIAHEVNNMMAVVLGFGDFLLRDVRLPADCLADLREMMKAADRAAAVTRQLLAFSRRAVHHPEPVRLAVAVRNAEPTVRRLLGEGRRLVVTAACVCRVRVDPSQLQQVIINLALNARDAMPVGGTLTITTAEITLPEGIPAAGGATMPAGHYASIVLSDDGAGMDAATQTRIFEPFFTTKPVGQGTGLGLPAALGVLTQHNGYITVTSAPGKGTAFTVFLPLVPNQDPDESVEDSPLAATADPSASATVLVVDDEDAVRTVAVRSLEQAGFKVVAARDGLEALELVDRHGPPDLVLTDLTMPGIGGAELARRLKERWAALPVVFMSGYSAAELERQGALSSEGGLIQKPFSPTGLAAEVTAALLRAHPPVTTGG